ncbi:deoxyribose-phosphate aldolase [bacterium]|nr:MAG: deoxyribose-phosphate aldolase [bacterium]
MPARRSVKKTHQIAWLLKAITFIDLTTLGGDDTPSNVRRLCAKARRPVREEILTVLGAENLPIRCAAVCVYPEMVPVAVKSLEGADIPVASVAAAFPHGLAPLATRLAEIRAAVDSGAREIDIVITRGHALRGEWNALYDEVAACREACSEAHLKTILATGELGTLTNVARASIVAMMAGSDFIKTSTGKETTNATLAVGLTMTRQIRDFEARTGQIVGFKPAGGIRTAKDAMDWTALMKEELGNAWLTPDLFRLGASTLLTDIERQLEHAATGHYAASYKQPMG